MPERFDYVIVGAGVAGCVLANRLSAPADVSVLLLEAGPWDHDPRVTRPNAWHELLGGAYDWRYRTEPQPHLGGRELAWPRGRVIGGSGALNAMVHIRGNTYDFDNWGKWGGPDWSADRLLPRFQAIEAPSAIGVAELAEPHPFSAAFVSAAVARGLPANPDFNGDRQDGVGFYRTTRRGTARDHTAQVYLRPALSRPNLTVRAGATVLRVETTGDRVTSVTYVQDGTVTTVGCDREVVLSAGTVATPHLLMLSGIGDPAELLPLGIPVAHDLPGVGQNLHDHIQVSVSFSTAIGYPISPESNLGEAGGFLRTRPGLPAPDLQLSFAPMLNLNNASALGNGFTIGPAVTRPESRGELTLRSADVRHPPRIQPNYLSSPADLDVLVDGVGLALELADTEPLKQFRTNDAPALPAGAGRDQIERYVRDNAETQFHPVGTCRFGDDELAVVDPALRIRGLDGLRVADASVIPAVPTGNIQAAVVVIAEIAAELIAEQTSQ